MRKPPLFQNRPRCNHRADHRFCFCAEIAEAFAARLANIESRLAKIEKSKAMSYRGVFVEREAYEYGDYCTYAGSLWCAIRDTSPGDAPGRSAS